MWMTMALLFAPAAFAERFEYVPIELHAGPESILLDRYADLLDDDLRRRFQRRLSAGGSEATGRAQGELLGSAAAQAATDWSVWVLRSVPTPALSLPLPQRRTTLRRQQATSTHSRDVEPLEGEPRPPRRLHVEPERPPAPALSLAVTPRWTPDASDRPVEAVVQATARHLGPSAWRVSSKPLAKTWSVWMRQDLSARVAMIASAESTPRKPELANVGSGLMFRVPASPVRLATRYAHHLPRGDRLTEHRVMLNGSIIPARRKRTRSGR